MGDPGLGRAGTRAGERGSGSVLVVGVVVCLLTVVVGGLVVASAVAAAHRARGAADLAALAAASALARGDDPCPVAVRVATGDAARLVSCQVVGTDVAVVCAVRSPRGLPDAVATSSAGPLAGAG